MHSGNNSLAVNLVATRGNRVTATILGSLEAEIYERHSVPVDIQKKVRQIVLDQLNGYKDLVIDIVKSDTAVMNDHYVETVEAIHRELQDMKRGRSKAS